MGDATSHRQTMASQPSTPGGVSTLGSSEPGSARKGGAVSRSQSPHQLREVSLLSSTSFGGGGGGHNPFGVAEHQQLTADSHATFNCMLCKLSLADGSHGFLERREILNR